MAMPTAFGAAPAHGGSPVNPGMPAGWQANDIILVMIMSKKFTFNAETGYTIIPGFPKDGPSNGGGEPWYDAGGDHATRLHAFWRRAVGGDTMPNWTGGSGGTASTASVLGVRGCITTGDPIEVVGASNTGYSPGGGSTGNAIPGITTLGPNRLVVMLAGDSKDRRNSGWASPTLTGITEHLDSAHIAFATGGKVTSGATGNSAFDLESGQDPTWLAVQFALKSADVDTPAGAPVKPVGRSGIRALDLRALGIRR